MALFAGKTMYCADTEGDDLLDGITKFHVMSVAKVDNQTQKRTGLYSVTSYGEMAKIFGREENVLIMHNGQDFDYPAAEKLLDIKVKALVVDTLWLSWYLEPRRMVHGLEAYGREFGVPKVEVDDWVNLTEEKYTERCERDVEIQVKLWQSQVKALRSMYGRKDEDVERLILGINWKAEQLRLQGKSKIKLDKKSGQELLDELNKGMSEAIDSLAPEMPRRNKTATRKPPKKPYKVNGELSATGARWAKLTEEHGLPFDHKEPIKEVVGSEEGNPNSHQQIKEWLFSLGWKPTIYKDVKEDKKVRKIPQIRSDQTKELCTDIARLAKEVPALNYLQDIGVLQHRIGLVKGMLNAADDHGYVAAQAQGLTNTLRLKHKVLVNLPGVSKAYGYRIRGMLVARGEDTEFCGADLCSLEDRTKQHFIWPHDPEYVKTMMSEDFDPHLDMAEVSGLMSASDVEAYKKFDPDKATDEQVKWHKEASIIRHVGKTTNYAATYGAQAATIAATAGVPIKLASQMHKAYWERNWALEAVADSLKVQKRGGVSWVWNPVAKRWYYLKAKKDRFSTLNQGTGAFIFDLWLKNIVEAREQLSAQSHDEGVWELNVGYREQMTDLLKGAIQKVNEDLKLNRDMDCDVQFGRNYGDIH